MVKDNVQYLTSWKFAHTLVDIPGLRHYRLQYAETTLVQVDIQIRDCSCQVSGGYVLNPARGVKHWNLLRYASDILRR